jgi:hypothetical protein
VNRDGNLRAEDLINIISNPEPPGSGFFDPPLLNKVLFFDQLNGFITQPSLAALQRSGIYLPITENLRMLA